MSAGDVDRRRRHNLFRLVMLGLHEPSSDPRLDARDRRDAVGAAMDLLDYIETLEQALERARIRLMAGQVDRLAP